MLGAEVPRSSRRRVREMAHPLVSLSSPLPLMVAAIGVTVLVIALVTLPLRPPPPDANQTPNLSDVEVLSLVAHDMRSGDAAARVLSEGRVRFADGTWYVSVGSAHFHLSLRNRIVVAEDPPAIQLEYRAASS
jgi:hypothetical protein